MLIIKWIKVLECSDVGFSDKLADLAYGGKALDVAYPAQSFWCSLLTHLTDKLIKNGLVNS